MRVLNVTSFISILQSNVTFNCSKENFSNFLIGHMISIKLAKRKTLRKCNNVSTLKYQYILRKFVILSMLMLVLMKRLNQGLDLFYKTS